MVHHFGMEVNFFYFLFFKRVVKIEKIEKMEKMEKGLHAYKRFIIIIYRGGSVNGCVPPKNNTRVGVI